MRPLLFLSALLLCTAFVPAAGARPFLAGPGLSPGGFLAHHADRLDLDEETRTSIEGIVVAARAEGKALHTQLREAREVLHTLLAEDAPDEAVVMQQAGVIGGLETALMKHRLRSMLQIRALLTPEQRAELETIREEGPFRRFDAVREACAGEKETECPADEQGPRRYFCMRERADELSEGCRQALESMPRHRRHKGGRRGPPDGEL